MRVHLRGVVIGVGIVLSVVVIVSVFNAFDEPSDDVGDSNRRALRMDEEAEEAEDEAGAGPRSRNTGPKARNSRMSPRSSTRLRPQGGRAGGGPGGRAGGPGARAGPRAGGPGGRAGGPGGPGGPRARGPGARAGGPGGRAGGPGGPGARAGAGPGGRPRGPAVRRAKAAEKNVDMDEDEEDEEEEEEYEEEEEEEERPSRRKSKKTKGTSEEKEEKLPKKKEPPYPDWWKTSYPRSAVTSVIDQFVADQPLFPVCPTFDAGPAGKGDKRYGLLEPPNLMGNSKNPCWFEWTGKKDVLKCLPYFYIAGAPKCGTTDLFIRISGHPTIMAGGSPTYYWWDRQRYGASKSLKYTKEAKRMDDPVSLKEYAKLLIASHGKNVTKQLLYFGRSDAIFGDATPTYLTENTQWDIFTGNEGCSEPRVIPATFIRHIFPKARIILLLRNPVERLYSRFLSNVPYVEEFVNHTASLFHTFAVQAVQNYRQCFAKTSIRHCAYNTSLYTNAVIRLSEGMYSVFLEDWFRIFEKEQILILKFEEYVSDVGGHLRRVLHHLGIDPLDDYNMQRLSDLPVVRRGLERRDAGYMLPETVALLSEFYSAFNLKLADLLGDDKWLFSDGQIQQASRTSLVVGVDTEEEEIIPPAGGGEENDAESEKEGDDVAGDDAGGAGDVDDADGDADPGNDVIVMEAEGDEGEGREGGETGEAAVAAGGEAAGGSDPGMEQAAQFVSEGEGNQDV